jgi:hypothetical protein
MTNSISYFLLENDGRLCPKAHQLVQDICLRLRWVGGDSNRHLWGYLAVRPIYKCPFKGQNKTTPKGGFIQNKGQLI